jgi:hypothetical protein
LMTQKKTVISGTRRACRDDDSRDGSIRVMLGSARRSHQALLIPDFGVGFDSLEPLGAMRTRAL